MSAQCRLYLSKADIDWRCWHVRFGPILFKKSAFTSDLIFAGALMRRSQKHVGDYILAPTSNERPS